MIDLYTWDTSNGRKVSIMLEEIGAAYTVIPVNLEAKRQFELGYAQISPDRKIPAIVDHAPPPSYGSGSMTMFESGAILVYLAKKSGKLMPQHPRARNVCLQWLMFQMGGIGPMFAQLHYFNKNKHRHDTGSVERFSHEVHRLYGVLNRRLADTAYLAGDDYTIADIATYPWPLRHAWQEVDLTAFPNVRRWCDAIDARAAVQKGLAALFGLEHS